MKKIIVHLSDLHYGKTGTEKKRIKRLFRAVGDRYPGAPVLITGDLTDSATKGELRGMRKELDILAKTNPLLTVPGNHDYAWKGIELRKDGWKHWVEFCGSPLGWGRDHIHWMGTYHEPRGIDGLGIWEDDEIVYFGVDSGDPTDQVISAQGYISGHLADALHQNLQQYRDRIRVVILHHHPFDDAHFVKLHGADKLMRAVEKNCELLLFGHKHHYGLWRGKADIPLTVSSHKSTNRLSGSCLGITLIEIKRDKEGLSLKHWLEIVK